MKCICGYAYAEAARESRPAFESFALIDDKEYRKFLRAEINALESKQLPDIAKATRLLGSLVVCPECGVIRIAWPDKDKPVSFLVPAAQARKRVAKTTPIEFQKIALSFPEAGESPHFEKTSFRVRNKIFATMAPEKTEAVVKLTPGDQQVFCGNSAGAIQPVAGKWGEQGWTAIDLEQANKKLVKDALTTAYCTVAPKKLAQLLKCE